MKHTLESFIKKSEELYPDCYDYSKVNYVNNYTKVTLICKNCGKEFEMTPCYLWKYGGCECQRKYKKIPYLTTETFIKRAEEKYGKGTYGYDRVDYINNYTKVKIYCPKCKDYFEIKPSSFLYRICKGCPKCAQREIGLKNKTPQEEWIKRAEAKWGDVCDYSETVYSGTKQKVRIYCKEHQGYFEQLPSVHLNAAYGCPICSFKHTASESLGEKAIENVLISFGIKYDREYQVRGIIQGRNSKILRIDFRYFLGTQEYWIEYQGEQHYTEIKFFSHGDSDWYKKQKERDQSVRDYCRDHGIRLLEIPYTYYNSDSLKEIITDFDNGRVPKIIIPESKKAR